MIDTVVEIFHTGEVKLSGMTAGLIVGMGLLMAGGVWAATTGTLLPIGDGTYASWTPKTGSTHYTIGRRDYMQRDD